MKLSDYASNTYSQFGEDGMIARLIEERESMFNNNGVCVEFGASSGPEGSCVSRLWSELRWRTLLIEADEGRFNQLKDNVGASVTCVNARISPLGPETIDKVLEDAKFDGIIDLMSIDVDGNDYEIWKYMTVRPRIICIEFNPTIPPHVSIHQKYDPEPMGFGSSVKALVELGNEKGYLFVGASHCNAFFVEQALALYYRKYDNDLMELFPHDLYSYLITDYQGRALCAGKTPPFGLRIPYRGPEIVGDPTEVLTGSVHETIFSVFDEPKQTMGFYEGRYGERSIRWEPNSGLYNVADEAGPAQQQLAQYMDAARTPILIETRHVSNMNDINWIYYVAEAHGYSYRIGGGIILLVKGEL